MPTFQYEAIDNSGNPKQGSISAGSVRDAIMQIHSSGLSLTSITEDEKSSGASFSAAELKNQSKKLLDRLTGMGNIKNPSPSSGQTPKPKARTKTVTKKVKRGYNYVAYDAAGNPEKGVLTTATSEKQAIESLNKRGLFVSKINERFVKEKEQVEVADKKAFKRSGAFFGSLKSSVKGGVGKVADDMISAIPGGQALKKAVTAARSAGKGGGTESTSEEENTADTVSETISDTLGQGSADTPIVQTLSNILDISDSGFAMLHQDLINLGEKFDVLIQAQLNDKLDQKELMNELKKGKGKGAGAAGAGGGGDGDGDGDGGGLFDTLMDAAMLSSLLPGGGRGKGKGKGKGKGRRKGAKSRARRMRGRGRFGRIGAAFGRIGGMVGSTRAGSAISRGASRAGRAVSTTAGAVGRGAGAVGRGAGAAAAAGGRVGAAGGALARGGARIAGKGLRALGPLGLAAGAGLGAFFEGGDAKERALARGASEGQANAEMIGGGALGALDAFNPLKLITMFGSEDSFLGKADKFMSVENQLEGVKALGDSSTYRQIGSMLSFGLIDSSADKVEQESNARLDKVRKRGDFFKGLIAAAGGNEGRAQLSYYRALLDQANQAKSTGKSSFSLKYFNGPEMDLPVDKAIERIEQSITGAKRVIAFDENPPSSSISTATTQPSQEMKTVASSMQNRAAQNSADVNNSTQMTANNVVINSPSQSTAIGVEGGSNGGGDNRMTEPSFMQARLEVLRAEMF